MAKIRLKVVSPAKNHLDEEVTQVVIPGADGEFGILPQHTTLMTTLGEGRLVFTHHGSQHGYDLKGGFAEVCDNQVVVIADQVIREI